MPDQFDVHPNPGRNKAAIPFVVVVQSNRFRDAVQRVVVPLVAVEMLGLADNDVAPHFHITDRDAVLDPLRITNVPRDALGPPIASLAGEEGRVVDALDAVLSQTWR